MLRQRVITAVIAVVLILLALFVFPRPVTLLLLGALILAAVMVNRWRERRRGAS